jgi:hypothetical protein
MGKKCRFPKTSCAESGIIIFCHGVKKSTAVARIAKDKDKKYEQKLPVPA